MNKITKILISAILIMNIICVILIMKLSDNLIKNEKELNKRMNNVEIKCKLYYEDILELIEYK